MIECGEMEWLLGSKPITIHGGIKESLLSLLSRQQKTTISPINQSKKRNKLTFLLIYWFMKWRNKLKDIITVLSYIGWPVLNNKSTEIHWCWFIEEQWAGLCAAALSFINSFHFSLRMRNGIGVDWKKRSAALVESIKIHEN